MKSLESLLQPARQRLSRLKPRVGLGLAASLGLAGLLGSGLLHGEDITGGKVQPAASDPAPVKGAIQAVWSPSGESRILRNWTPADLIALRTSSSAELDPSSGKVSHWKGALLSDLIDQSVKALTNEQRASLDLVILVNKAGEQVLIPRSLIKKYPIMLAYQRDRKPVVGEAAPAQLVLPWTSRPKMRLESLPLEKLFVGGLSRVVLTNLRERYRSLFLTRRTDPSAIRGENLFVKNCVSCHSAGGSTRVTELSLEAKTRVLASSGHPLVKGLPKLTSHDHRALVSYLDALRLENPPKTEAPASAQAIPVVAPSGTANGPVVTKQ